MVEYLFPQTFITSR